MMYFWKEHEYKPHVNSNNVEFYMSSVFLEAETQ